MSNTDKPAVSSKESSSNAPSESLNTAAASAFDALKDPASDAHQKLQELQSSISSSASDPTAKSLLVSIIKSATDKASSAENPTQAFKSVLGSVTGALGLSKDPENNDPNKNPLRNAVVSVTGALGLGGEGSAAQKGAELGQMIGEDARRGVATGLATTVYGQTRTEKREQSNREQPLGDLEQHAHDSTLVGYLGGTLGGVTRTVGGTVGALGSGLGQTTTSVSGGGPPKSDQKSDQKSGSEDEGSGDEVEDDERGAKKQKKKKKNWGQQGGDTIQTGGNAVKSGTDTAARALENISKGYPMQWQDLTGDKRLS